MRSPYSVEFCIKEVKINEDIGYGIFIQHLDAVANEEIL